MVDEREGAPPSEPRLSTRIEKSRVRHKSYSLDLRVHSPTSPSTFRYLGVEGLDPAPALVSLAKVKKLDVIAVTDYYSGAFIDRVIDAAKHSPLIVIPGVDLRCKVGACDDVVISALFPESFNSAAVEGFLRSLDVPASAAGRSSYVLPHPFVRILDLIEAHGGVALPSRVDKTPQRIDALKILVEDFGFRAFDLAYSDSARIFKSRWPKVKFQLYTFSNAYALAQVGSRTARVKMLQPGFEGVKELIRRDQGLTQARAGRSP
jgi:hypothetical protein